jgi:hypothetical protein
VSLATDLAAMLAITELTHPVTLGGGSTRGILDESGAIVPLAGTELQRIGRVLYLQKDSVAGIAPGADITLGALGATSAAGGASVRLAQCEPIDDGLIIACQLSGGR